MCTVLVDQADTRGNNACSAQHSLMLVASSLQFLLTKIAKIVCVGPDTVNRSSLSSWHSSARQIPCPLYKQPTNIFGDHATCCTKFGTTRFATWGKMLYEILHPKSRITTPTTAANGLIKPLPSAHFSILTLLDGGSMCCRECLSWIFFRFARVYFLIMGTAFVRELPARMGGVAK